MAAVEDNALIVFSRDSGTGQVSFEEAKFDGVDGVDGLAGAVRVVVSSDGAHVYVAGLLDAKVAVFRVLPPVVPVPTLGPSALGALVGLVLLAGVLALRARRDLADPTRTPPGRLGSRAR